MNDIYNIVYKKLKSFEQDENVIQEVMIKFYLNIDNYDSSIGTLNAFLTVIHKNVVIDLWRRNKKARLTNSIDCLNNPMAFTAQSRELNALDSMILSTYITKLLEAIKMLPENDRIIINKILEGKKYKEISVETNRPIGTIKGAVHRIKKKLKKSIKQ